MKASDIMVTDVITVSPDSNVQDVAELLLKHRISGVPVVDVERPDGRHRERGRSVAAAEAGTGHERSWWLKLLMGREVLAAEYVQGAQPQGRRRDDPRRDHRRHPTPPVSEIAALLERNRIKRVPIVHDGKLVGIVSRANLLQALASMRKEIAVEKPIADSELREKVMARLKAEPWVRRAWSM